MQNQMNFNNPNQYYGYGVPQQMHMYSQPAYKLPNNQPLKPDETDFLRAHQYSLEMTLKKEDLMAGSCTHRDARNGDIAYTIDENGMCHCSICGKEWKMTEQTIEELRDAISKVKYMLQTIKCAYYDMPASLITEVIAPLLCLLDKLEALWFAAMRNFKKYEDMNMTTVNPIGMFGGGNAFNQYQSVTTMYNPMGQPMYGQQMVPQYNPQMQQFNPQMVPQGYVQQPMNPQMVNPVAQQFNPQMVPATQVSIPQGGYFPNVMSGNPVVYNDGGYPGNNMPVGYVNNAPVAAPAPAFNNAPAVGAVPDMNNAPAAAPATAPKTDIIQQQRTYDI